MASIKPKYFILENVNRILTIDNKQTIQTIKKILKDLGYLVDIFQLDSKDYEFHRLEEERLYMD